MNPALPPRRAAPVALAVLAVLAAIATALVSAPRAAGAGSPPRPDEVRRKKGELQIVGREVVGTPDEDLALAAELARCGTPFYTALFARAAATGPDVRAATAEGAQAAARAIAARLLLSGEGVPVAASRFAELEHQKAKAAGEKGAAGPREHVEQRLQAFAKATGFAARPLRPVYVPAAPGGEVRPAALGFAILAAVRLAAPQLQARRPQPAGPPLVGETAEAGYEALVLLHAASATLQSLKSTFAFDGKALGEAVLTDYDPFAAPRWFPRAVKITPPGEGTAGFEVGNAGSRLWDEAALLLAVCEYARLGDLPPDLFPLGLAGTARDLAGFLVKNLAALHFDPTPGRLGFVSEWTPGARGKMVDPREAALAVLALEAALEVLGDDAKARGEAKKLCASEAAFLLGRLRPDGAFPLTIDLGAPPPPASGPAAGPDGLAASAGAEALVVQAFLAAHRATGEKRFAAAATRLARALDERRFDPWAGLHLESDPAAEAELGPLDQGFILGMLRDLTLEAKAPEALDRFGVSWRALAAAKAFEGGAATTLRVRVAR